MTATATPGFIRERRPDAGFDGASHAGKTRGHNEDAYGIDAALGVAVVSDGMGGLDAGEVASRIAVEGVLDGCRGGSDLAQCLSAADGLIRRRAAGTTAMGATAVAVRLAGARAQIAWIGDSRAYLWRDGRLRLLTRDHSFVQELIDLGAITAEEARRHPHRHVVRRALGVGPAGKVEPETLDLPLAGGDRLLLCSDGLHGFLPESAIAEVLAQNRPGPDTVAALVRRTLDDSAAEDNVTAVLVSFPT